MFVDSHCHLDRLSPDTCDGDLDKALNAARARGVKQFLAISVTLDGASELAEIRSRHDDVVISAGVHPLQELEQEPSIDDIVRCAEEHDAVAIGESGLDYHYDSVPREVQHERFARHLQAATRLGLPIVVHTREAREDTLALIREHSDPDIGGVLHCFTEDIDMARAAVAQGFYISLSGIVTFRNAESLRELARCIPLDRLLIETDSPYLAPVPYRGRPNQPAWVVEVAECIAQQRGISVEEVGMQTTANFHQLFRRAAPSVDDELRQQLINAGMSH
ncbi:TatD family hydrolase [Halomonas huangheensis]|uniref:TatD family hydrolase n=1 Tax=Halomonas huangheensis TaxID=1178482 RepID=W1N362_9GAMM|nr:TatD family hydrolase [Halomonas huangheensis]ALM52179.1 hydrolase TatD [Halomonas huangheensis]ERL49395.1 hypothetical protein BJB45_06345 [Halomonas huangheensis]